MEDGIVSLIIVNSYVDFDDYENVIKTYADERFYFKTGKGIAKDPEILIRKNHVVLNDEFFQIGQTERREFYSAENFKSDFDLDSSELFYARMQIRMEAREDTYERTVFSVFDYTGLIGGVFEIFEVVGGFVVGYFSKKWFMFCMLSSLYQVQDKGEDQDCSRSSTSNPKDSNEEHKFEEDSKICQRSNQEDEKSDGHQDKSHEENKKSDEESEEEKSGGESEDEKLSEKSEDKKLKRIQLHKIDEKVGK